MLPLTRAILERIRSGLRRCAIQIDVCVNFGSNRPHGVSQFLSVVDRMHIEYRRRLHELTDVSHRLLPTTAAKLPGSIETTYSQAGAHVTQNCNRSEITNTLQFGAPVHLLKNMADTSLKPSFNKANVRHIIYCTAR